MEEAGAPWGDVVVQRPVKAGAVVYPDGVPCGEYDGASGGAVAGFWSAYAPGAGKLTALTWRVEAGEGQDGTAHIKYVLPAVYEDEAVDFMAVDRVSTGHTSSLL